MQHSTGQYDDLARVPRARPREGCRRRTTASRHRRHSPARCSCRVVPPIRDARLVDLNLAVFMCNSVARQERVCRAQRPAAKIDALATSASGRDRTSAFEPAETPANCGLSLRDRETSVSHRTAWWAREKSQLCGPTTTYREVRAIWLD